METTEYDSLFKSAGVTEVSLNCLLKEDERTFTCDETGNIEELLHNADMQEITNAWNKYYRYTFKMHVDVLKI